MIEAPLKTTEAARALGLSRATIYRMINDGRLSAYEPVPGQLRIERSEIERIKRETRRRPEQRDVGPMIEAVVRSPQRRREGSLRDQLATIRGRGAA